MAAAEKTKPAQAQPAPAQAPAQATPAQERRKRALAAGATAHAKTDPTARYTLAGGEQWHELPTGGKCAITTTDSGFESVVEISSQGRVRRGVSVLAITTLVDAGRL